MNARQLAATVLGRVWSDQAYAAAALSHCLEKSTLAPRDRGLATELTYGVLRTQGYLERRIGEFGKLKQSDHQLLAHLLIGVYQIDFLDRVPARAAVNEAVTLVSQLRGSKVAAFANAVLRRCADSTDEKSVTLEQGVMSSTPSWLRKRLVRQLGDEGAIAILCPARTDVPYLRGTGRETEEFKQWFIDNAELCAGVPFAYRYVSGGDPRKAEAYQRGEFVVQELGAQLIAHALDVREGHAVVDVCAGRGQKTSLLAQLAGPSGEIVATDLHAHKVSALLEEMERLQVSVEAQVWDWNNAPPARLRGRFDRVLVDAPCTGIGTLSRRPEIMRRMGPSDPSRLAKLQETIARHAALALAPDGVLLFSTCSVLPEEAEAVVERLCEQVGLVPATITSSVDNVIFGEGEPVQSCFRLLPQTHATDGYFIARLTRKSA